MTLMAAKAIEFLESLVEREKQQYIGIIERPNSNTVEVRWTDVMQDCDSEILGWFSHFFLGQNRRNQLVQSNDMDCALL